MINQLLLALILTVLPVSELRIGMPIAINYALKQNIPIITIILLVILLNCLVVFAIFLFLDKFHEGLMNFVGYRKFYEAYLRRIRKKVDKFEKRYAAYGFLALIGFVAIPLPGTGAWTGTIIAWILDLERKKSIAAIMLGVIIAGILVSLATLAAMGLFLFS